MALDELCQSGSNDRLIFFFAGHGTTGRGQLGYIIPQDADKGKYSQYIGMEDLRLVCHEIPAKHIFIILDCCFSGVAALSAKADLQSPEQIDDGYLTKATEHKAWQILTAGADDELVADGGVCPGHSPFMGALLDGLRGEADENKDNLITALELNNYIQSRVSRETTKYGAKGQMPFFNYIAGSDLGNFVFLLPGYGKTDKSTRAERVKKIHAILQNLSSNDVLPDPIIRKAERIIATKPEELSQEDQSFDGLLDQLLKGDLKSKQFVSEWFRLADREEEWNGCISWDGNERSLPSGGQIRVPGLRIDKLVKKYAIVDTESENGFEEINPEELQPGMAIIDAIINERLFNQLVLSWGKKAIMITPSDRSEPLDRWEWKERFNTDGLKLWVIQNAQRTSQGKGVLINRFPSTGDLIMGTRPWIEKGNILDKKGQYDEAIEAYDKPSR